MIKPLFKRNKSDHVYTWESQPYVFIKGAIYVIEVDISKIAREEFEKLDIFFKEQGVKVKIVATKGDAIKPIQSTRKKEQPA